jgi:hypothetical protein
MAKALSSGAPVVRHECVGLHVPAAPGIRYMDKVFTILLAVQIAPSS